MKEGVSNRSHGFGVWMVVLEIDKSGYTF